MADQGPGMDAAVAARIAERFFRADPSRSRAGGEGSGLGMSIVDDIASRHGGSMRIESTPESGTTVTIVLPSAPDPGIDVWH